MITVKGCEDLRREIKKVADYVRISLAGETAVSEAVANVTLAFRHLEDASMRLGKAIQALDGGVSIYDKTQVPR